MDVTDQQVIEAIKSGGAVAERALSALHRHFFFMVKKNVGKHKLNFEDIHEAYLEALLHLKTSILNDKYHKKGTLQAFFAIIFRNKCIDILRRATTNADNKPVKLEFDLPDDPEYSPESILIAEEDHIAYVRQTERRKACLALATAKLKPEENRFLEDFYVKKIKPRDMLHLYDKYKTARVVSSTAVELKKKLLAALREVCQMRPECSMLCA